MNPARVLSAAPDAAIGLAFLTTWLLPRWMGVEMLNYALLTMLLEFIVIHSSGFMGGFVLESRTKANKSVVILGLGLMYTLFVGAFSFAFKTWWPLVAFWSLTLNRLMGVLLHTAPEGEEREQLMTGWATSALLYLFWVFLTLLLPLPRLGLTPAVVADAQLPGSGVWIDSPQKVIVAGAGYFLMQAYVELNAGKWFKLNMPQSQRG